MAIKTHKVTLSLDNPRVIQSGINVQSFDKQSIQISIELTKNDEFLKVPSDATIRISLLKLANQSQRIVVDVPNTNRDSIDWIVPDYLDGYQGTVRVGVYLVNGTENVDLGYFTILSMSDTFDKMADEFVDNVFQGWEQIEADLNELNLTIAQTKLDLADDLAQVDSAIANINAKNTQVDTLTSNFADNVATKQADVTSKYNAFDTDITQANQTIDDILGLADDVQQVSAQLAEKVQNFKLKNEIVNGDFSQGNIGFIASGSGSKISVVDDKLNVLAGGQYKGAQRPTTTILTNKYYLRAKIDGPTNIYFGFRYGSLQKYKKINGVEYVSLVRQSTSASNNIEVLDNRVSGNTLYTVDELLMVDLTTIFGAGNEPTKEEMDRLVEMVPNQWWDGELDLTQQQYVSWMLSFIREKANKAQEEWITPTLLNGWVNYDGVNFQSAEYITDTLGFVVIRGVVKSGTIGQPIFRLPDGYRPSKFYRFDTVNNYSHCAGYIANNGNVVINTASANHSVSLNIRFKAEV